MDAVLFYIFAGVTLISALGVAVGRDIVRCTVWLLACLTGLAGLYWNLAADFVAATQILVYVGGVLVLMLFGILLTGRSAADKYDPPAWERGLSAALAAALAAVLLYGIAGVDWDAIARRGAEAARPPDAGWGLTGRGAETRGKTLAEARAVDAAPERSLSNTRDLGRDLLSDDRFLPAFYLAGVHLLTVLIGAAWLARNRRPEAGDSQEDAST